MTREVINELKKYTVGKKNTEKTEISVLNLNRLIFALEEQESKTGHWIWQTEDIYRCSECGEDIHVKEVMNIPQYKCCPMCLAKMVDEQESEEV